jgi:hypothetical protein
MTLAFLVAYGGRPLHVVVADNDASREAVVMTVYEPDQDRWHSDFRRPPHLP